MKSILIFSVMMMAGVAAFAQERTPRTNTRQAAQRARIHDGQQGGDLTKRERTALNAEQRHIRRAERRAKADGDVTVAERRKLERKQDRASRHIRRTKNNPAKPE